jgi:hypothetical protein
LKPLNYLRGAFDCEGAVHKTLFRITLWNKDIVKLELIKKLLDRGGVKRIPEQLLSEMNEAALAILLGDDGTYDSSSNTVKISVDRYTYEDRELLRHWLKTSFKIDASVQKDRIYILRSSFPTLIRIVSNHLPRFMHYKLGLRPPP